MTKHLIFLLEDEEDIARLIKMHLEQAHFLVEDFTHVADFRSFLTRRIPDIAILDLMLPDGDGLELLKELRSQKKTKNIGVILLTARAHEADVVLGLEFGADDYITKPFSVRELLGRVKALLRRLHISKEENLPQGLVLDSNKREVRVDGRLIDLTKTEFELLELFLSNPGWVFPRDQILDHIWGLEKAVTDRTVDVHISHLRDKLGPWGKHIKNIRGIGYKYDST